jgi:uncharacterized protein DUF6074
LECFLKSNVEHSANANVAAFPAAGRHKNVSQLARAIYAANSQELSKKRLNNAVNRLIAEFIANDIASEVQAAEVEAYISATNREILRLQLSDKI